MVIIISYYRLLVIKTLISLLPIMIPYVHLSTPILKLNEPVLDQIFLLKLIRPVAPAEVSLQNF